MWPFDRKSRPRRVEGRRNGPAAGPTRWQRFRQAGGAPAVLIALAFYALVLALDVTPLEPLGPQLGGYLPGDIYARVDFRVYSPQATASKRQAETKMTPAVIRLDEQALQKIQGEIRNLPGKLRSATRPAELDKALAEAFNIRTAADLADFARLATPAKAEAFNRQVETLRQKLTEQYVVTGKDYSDAYYSKHTPQVHVLIDGQRQAFDKSRLLDLENTRDLNDFLTAATQHLDSRIQDNILHYLKKTFEADVPIFRIDAEATAADEQAARDAIRPQSRLINAGTLLAKQADRARLSREQRELLAAEHCAFLQRRADENPLRVVGVFLGRAALVAAVVVFMCLYIYKYRPRVVKNPLRSFSIATLLALMLLYSKGTAVTGGMYPYLAVFGVFTGAVILAIVYDQRFAFALSGALAVLTALQLRLGLGGLLVLWAAPATAVFQLREVRTRSKLIATGVVTAAGVFAAVWAVEAAAAVPAWNIVTPACLAAGAALAGGFLAQGILPLIERIFGVATSLTLLEWCDANKPLLKRLALEAPGTYSHSLLLGSMCEAAAEAIGARGLLGRVGAYYHDVGKINKPGYFNENQLGPGSRHDRLSPAMSLLVIKGHVKDGLELARQYGLPRQLHEFITSHHGTTLVEYFYHAAAEQRKRDAAPAPDEVEFRYPGPKPRLREAAILMLADAAESSVRAMPEPTPGRIETQVGAVVSKRLTGGQLDDCDLTLREVHGIEASLTKSLTGIYHGRVRYPSQEKPRPAAAANDGQASGSQK